MLDPVIELAVWRRLDGIQPTGTLRAHCREPPFAQDAQMLGHRRLGDPELRPDALGDRARRLLTARKELENAPADGITEDRVLKAVLEAVETPKAALVG